MLPLGSPGHHSRWVWPGARLLPSLPRSRSPTIPCLSEDVPRSTDRVIPLSDDHHRSAHVVKYGLRNTSQEKAAERPEPSGSENDEVHIAAVRAPHDFPRRIALICQSLEREPTIAQEHARATEIRYDRSVVEDFVARLPEALRRDVASGREF